MRSESRTWIAILLTHVNAWRKKNGWSRETVVQAIVEAHERINGPAVAGIRFEPPSLDAFERLKANADRVFRWLDDATKDNNLLPVNFIPSILEAMPAEVRVHCVDDLLRERGVGCRMLGGDGHELNAVSLLRALLAENSEAVQAVAALVDGATREELLTAQRELTESREATNAALADIEALLREVSHG